MLPRLTLNYGLRYEHYGVQHNNKPQLDSNFYYGPGSGIEEQVRTGGVQIANQSSIGQFWAPQVGYSCAPHRFCLRLFREWSGQHSRRIWHQLRKKLWQRNLQR